MDSVCRVRNKIMYVLSWRTVSALTRVLFWYLFPEFRSNPGNKHQKQPSRERRNCSSLEYIHYFPYPTLLIHAGIYPCMYRGPQLWSAIAIPWCDNSEVNQRGWVYNTLKITGMQLRLYLGSIQWRRNCLSEIAPHIIWVFYYTPSVSLCYIFQKHMRANSFKPIL